MVLNSKIVQAGTLRLLGFLGITEAAGEVTKVTKVGLQKLGERTANSSYLGMQGGGNLLFSLAQFSHYNPHTTSC